MDLLRCGPRYLMPDVRGVVNLTRFSILSVSTRGGELDFSLRVLHSVRWGEEIE